MDILRLADNIAGFRKEKKITQDQLADVMGVTKASVSKWETRQSMPDISLLPQLAAFFDVSIDTLMGYEASLGKEQIRKIYLDLCKEFSGWEDAKNAQNAGNARKEFDLIMDKTKKLVKKYYSCYEFLQSIICLWVNHHMLPEPERSTEILEDARKLCIHVLENCRDIGLCKDTMFMKASIDLMLGNAQEVIEELEEHIRPEGMAIQGEDILINAYLQVGDLEKANDLTQIGMYLHMIALVQESVRYMIIHKDRLQSCEETLYRVTELARIYNLEELNFNAIAVFHFQMAVIYCEHGEKAGAVEQLQKYITLSMRFLQSDDSFLKKDAYFDRLDIWFDKTLLAGNIPRDKKVIYHSLRASLNEPCFEILKDELAFQKLKNSMERFGVIYE